MTLPANLKPIPRDNARTLVFRQLRQWIEEGVLMPDETLRDKEIAKALGVSRTPVREAIQMLEQHGAVVTTPGRYTRVRSASPRDARLVYPPLSALQALAAELGTAKATPEDIVRMIEANERLLAAVQAARPVEAQAADDAFHDVLLLRAENPFLRGAIASLRFHTRRLETLYFQKLGPAHESYLEHQQIIAAARNGDAALAREITRQNFLRAQSKVSEE
jgi:DNA-binding GntR family transcriptional regulator